MRPRVQYHRDTLNTRRLPRDEPTFLDYRTRINREGFEHLTTLRLVFVASVLLVPLAVVGRLSWFVGAWFPIILAGLGLLLIVGGLFKAAFMERFPPQLAWGGMLLVTSVVAVFMEKFHDPRTAFLVLAMPALLMAAGLAFFVGKQVAFWMTANHQVGQQTMFQWRRLWSFSGEPEHQQLCPEIFTVPIVLAAAPVGCLAGFAVLHFFAPRVTHAAAGISALVVTFSVVVLAWTTAHVFVAGTWPKISSLPATAWRTLRIFVCYNRHGTPAAGVFQFPNSAFRPAAARDFVLGITLAFLSLAVVALLLPPPPPFSWNGLWRSTEKHSIHVAEHEWDRYRSLPAREAKDFLNRLTAEKKFAILAEIEREKNDRRRNGRWAPLFAALGFGMLGPPVMLLAFIALVCGSTVQRFYDSLERAGAPMQNRLTPWQTLVDRLINSPNQTEARHFFLGSSLYHDYPVLLDGEILSDHGHILGDTGARKTSLGIAPLATQLIAKRKSILMIDLKGEPALFHGMREEAARAGIPFKWFTNVAERSSYVFNPFLQKHWRRFNSNQKVQIILSALSLDYGFDYGRAFFTAMNEMALANLFRNEQIDSFEGIHRVLSHKEIYRKIGELLDWEKARHLVALVNRLRAVHALNLTPDALPNRPQLFDHAIELTDLLYEPQVVYFYLKAPVESLTAAGIAKLAVYSLFTAAAHDESIEKDRAFILIDEFQQMISNSVEQVLQQGRSLGVSFVLSHQTKGQAKRGGIDIQETVESCTAYKHNYRASDLRSIEELEKLSGQGMYHRFAWTQPVPARDDDEEDVAPTFSTTGEVMVTEGVGPLLERNLVMELSADQNGSFVRFTKDSGYTRFGGKVTPILSDFHIQRPEFFDRASRTFPESNGETIMVEPDFGDVIDVSAVTPEPPKNPLMTKRMPLLPDGSDPDEKLSDML
jgi:hypothetical protein